MRFIDTRRSAATVLFAITLLVRLVLAAEPSDWPQWRGPNGQGVSQESNLPDAWDASKNVRWKTPIPGRGHSSPVVWGNRIFLTTALDGDVVPGAGAVKHIFNGKEYLHPDVCCADRRYTLKVLALDRDTGRIVWDRTVYEGTVYDNRHRKNSYASSTAVTDGKRVYSFFESEGVYAHDLDGTLAWKSSVGTIAKAGLGPGTSPVLHGDLLIVQCDQENGDGAFIAGLNKDTGKEVWRTGRRHRRSWATPVLVRAAGRMELVTSGLESIIAYDPATGQELWRGPGVRNNPIPSPLVMDDIVIMSAGYPDKMTIAIRAGGSGDITGTPHILWTYNKGSAYVPPPSSIRGSRT